MHLCLVLDNPEDVRRRRYGAAGEPIAVHTVRSLLTALAVEITAAPTVSPELAKAVWQLGRADD